MGVKGGETDSREFGQMGTWEERVRNGVEKYYTDGRKIFTQ